MGTALQLNSIPLGMELRQNYNNVGTEKKLKLNGGGITLGLEWNTYMSGLDWNVPGVGDGLPCCRGIQLHDELVLHRIHKPLV